MKPRILLAGLYHESHSFLDQLTGWKEFNIRLGDEVFAKKGDASPTDGFLEVADAAGWQVIPTIDANAMASGTVEDAMFERFWTEFEARARPPLAAGVDAIFLVLHGAMVTESLEDPEGEFLERLRRLPGAEHVPIFGVLDLHGNISARMCALTNGLVAYHENPHTDARETAVRAARLLERCLREKKIPRMVWCRVPLILAPSATGSANEPMVSLNLLARKTEKTVKGVWAYNVIPGFSFADAAEVGLTLSAVVDADSGDAKHHLQAGAELAWSMRDRGTPTPPSVDSVVKNLPPPTGKPTLLVEPADNIGGGAPGDGTGILRALVAHDVPRSLVAINDPLTVGQLAGTAIGGHAKVAIGGRTWRLDSGPVELEVTLVSRGPGLFTLEDPNSHLASGSGIRYDMGPCAVVRHRGVTILLTSRKTPPFDLGQFSSQGIDVRTFDVIGVKAAVGHRQAYNPIAGASFDVDTPGPCTSNLHSLPYRRLHRPVYPLDTSGQLTPRFA